MTEKTQGYDPVHAHVFGYYVPDGQLNSDNTNVVEITREEAEKHAPVAWERGGNWEYSFDSDVFIMSYCPHSGRYDVLLPVYWCKKYGEKMFLGRPYYDSLGNMKMESRSKFYKKIN